jgi:hypothetical protein
MRQAKRKASRSPGILRDGPARVSAEHGVRVQRGLSWRMFSAVIVVSLLLVLAVFFFSDFFYVRSVVVGGTSYLSEAEVFRYANIAEMHIFWVDPVQVRGNIIESSDVVADARVEVSWPPDMVRIYVVEREPALIWTQDGISALVDVHGTRLRYMVEGESYPDLIQVVADSSMEGPPGLDTPIPPDAVTGALQLRSLLSGLRVLRYHPDYGLGFREGSWDVWLGGGLDMLNRLVIYETLRDDLITRNITPSSINVVDPEAAYYCGSIEGCYE